MKESYLSKLGIGDSNATKVLESLLGSMLEPSFGAMGKKEIEVLLMHLLSEHGNISDLSNHKLSILLKISTTRVKNLRYEMNLRYRIIDDDWLENELTKLIKNNSMLIEKTSNTIYISFVTENEILKQSILGKVKELHHFADTSFNTEILKLSQDSFITLIQDILGESIGKDFIKLIKKETKNKITSFKQLANMALEAGAKQVGKKAVNATAAALTGGMSEIGTLAELPGKLLEFVKLNDDNAEEL